MFVDVTKGSAFIFIAVMHPLINVSFMCDTHYIGLFTGGVVKGGPEPLQFSKQQKQVILH